MKRREIKYANSQRKDIIRVIIGSVVFTAAHLHKGLIVFFINNVLLCFLSLPLFLPQGAWSCAPLKTNLCSFASLKAIQPRSDRATQRFLSAQVCTTGLDFKQKVAYRLFQAFTPSLDQVRLDGTI